MSSTDISLPNSTPADDREPLTRLEPSPDPTPPFTDTPPNIGEPGLDAGTEEPRHHSEPDNAAAEIAAPEGWPEPCAFAAFHGLAGEFVALVGPHTEADPVGLLVQFLVAFGNVIGRTVYRTADGARHHLNLFAVLVGKSSKSRKGTSWARVRRPFDMVDPEWSKSRVVDGLSTGEGLIHAMRGSDKRLLVIEAEFARVLKVSERKDNTLSPVIRQGWDSGDLNVLTKNSPASVRGVHISIIGHITQQELKRNLNSTEIANGFANRFLWAAVRRSKKLPYGGKLTDEDLKPLAEKVKVAVDFARENAGEMEFTENAKKKWEEVYGRLSDDRDDLVGSIVSRAEAQVLRLACVYAALDCSRVIELAHLDAALALWDYCERSAEFIFGDSTGDQVADTILAALRLKGSDGLTRTEISGLFGRNAISDRIQAALDALRQKGLTTFTTESSNGGRSVERWKAVNRRRDSLSCELFS